MAYFLVGLQTLVAVVFVASTVGKLRSASAYAGFVAATRRLAPVRRHRRLAGAVVAAEAAVPVLLAVPVTVPLGFGLAGLLLAGFTAGILMALRRRESAPCNCFGASGAPLGYGQVVRNMVLAAVAGTGLLTALASGGMPGSPGVFAAVVAGGLLALLVIVADDIAALFRPAA